VGSVRSEDIAAELRETLTDAPTLEQIMADVREALSRLDQEGLLE
jgi:hypothetical protein